MVSTRIMVRPAIRCSRCIPISDTKQRAAATIGAMLLWQVASNELFISNLVRRKGFAFSPNHTVNEYFLLDIGKT